MKVLICGPSVITSTELIRLVLSTVEEVHQLDPDATIIQGCCEGVDILAAQHARHKGLKVHGVVPFDRRKVHPEWRRYCTSYEEMPKTSFSMSKRYMDRNQRMVDLLDPVWDKVISCDLEPEHIRSGNYATIRRARVKGVPVWCRVVK